MRTGGLALNEAGNESGDRWSGEKKKNRKGKKRDSLMCYSVRWSGVSVGRSVVPVKGESVCAVTVSKNGALVSLLGEGERSGEIQERRSKRADRA